MMRLQRCTCMSPSAGPGCWLVGRRQLDTVQVLLCKRAIPGGSTLPGRGWQHKEMCPDEYKQSSGPGAAHACLSAGHAAGSSSWGDGNGSL